jgi:four helix bundle protein
METGYRKLKVWQKADELACRVYRETRTFPKEELFGITSQLRRAVLSVPLNIVEGMGRQNKKELRQFVNIALGSLAATEYLLDFSHRLGYIKEQIYRETEAIRNETGRMLWAFHKSLSS